MIKVENLSLSIGGQQILKQIGFTLSDGENLIILGRSGSGKTMLIKTMMGLFAPDSGTVTVDGINVHKQRKSSNTSLRQSFAMVFQNSALLDSFTVFQNVALPLYERGEKESAMIRDKVNHCLELVGLEDTQDKYPAQLSGGMRKRVGIARALVYEPGYIIFDEPVSGLDPITAAEVIYYITQIIQSVSATTITITHDVRSLSGLGDRILFIEEGEAVFYGTHVEMKTSSDPLLQKFISFST